MRLEFSEKVEMALRDLEPDEEKIVKSGLEILEHEDPQRNREICPRLSSNEGSEQLLLLTVTPRLRAIFRYLDDDSAVIVEDLVSHSVLERYFQRLYS
jgi:mRNA-degrading endonuclease RelE of RelBE toxin-antitoxin system